MKDVRIILITVLSSFFTLLFFLRIAAGEGKLEVTSSVDREEVHIGDRINLEVTSPKIKDLDVIFPDEPKNMGEFSLLGSSPIKTGWGSSERIGRSYIISIYTTGTHVIPPVEVEYKTTEETAWNIALSPQVPIEVKSLLTGDDTNIHDIKGLISLGSGFGKFLFILFILALIAGAVYLFFKLRKRIEEERERRRLSPDEVAYKQLMELKTEDLPGKGMIKEYYSRLSDIARHYLEGRFAFRAPEMTTEEFLASLKGSPLLEDEHKKLLAEFLSHCDMVKFAKYGPTPLEIVDSFSSCEKLIDQTRKIPEEEEEEA